MVRSPAVPGPHLGYCPALHSLRQPQHISPVNKAIGILMRQFYHNVSLLSVPHRCWTLGRRMISSQAGLDQGEVCREEGRPPAGLFGLNTDKSPPKCHNSPLIVRLQPNLDSGQSKYCPPLSALLKWPHRPRHKSQHPKKVKASFGESMIYV